MRADPSSTWFDFLRINIYRQAKGAQVAFLLEPTPVNDMARIAFSGGVMPQKSTDSYPKLLTSIAIYRL